jgi:prepilin-type processing-associated H-X9-DG protein
LWISEGNRHGIHDAKERVEAMNPSRKTRRRAFTVPELLIVVFTLSVLAALIVPRLAWPRGCRAARITCVSNLGQIGMSFQVWALDNNGKYPMQVSVTNGGAMESIPLGLVYPQFQVMSNELSTPRILLCPNDTLRTNAAHSFGGALDDRNISYFVGVDAVDTAPQMFLAGDDNMLVGGKPANRGLLQLSTNPPVAWSTLRHAGKGNLCFADGSVQQVTSARLASGMATNRLLMP